jgi:hypothetical protein
VYDGSTDPPLEVAPGATGGLIWSELALTQS